ncbi:Protein FAR1-RELATED SEQUENCE 8 [Platanthera zijinensis]|uniref:Protein FAR1-RELATED SEQUENCE 8 n=1 Tax=Platanthera zijinensis TaxID=2320716 RepID=A0AAP0GCI5_9ASPA
MLNFNCGFFHIFLQIPSKYPTFPVVQSEDEAYALYCEYAHKTGFSVRKEHIIYWTHTRIIKVREYTCSKAGKKHIKPSPIKYRKLDSRTGCLACCHFRTDTNGQNWTVSKFVEEHNHPLALDKEKHLLRSNRKVSDLQGDLIRNMTGAGIKTVHAYNFLSEEVGGVENLGFSKVDAYNYVHRCKKSLVESGDSVSLLKMLQARQLDDSMFSYEVQTDELNRLTNFFWMDGRAKIDYDCYGDVIIFDTTYRLNKYNLACAPFIAVNNHWQSICVGCTFIAEETIESFCWVFDCFLKFVGGKQPITIFTDQDQAMAVAIERVFTTSRHRLCQWHISKKAPSKVPCFNVDKGVRGLFYQCMSKCDSEIEFEQYWSAMMLKGSLHDNRWLKDLYSVRHKWSTAYNKDVLDLGILSTQRSESANNGLHGCSKATSSLVECFIGLEKLLSTWRRAELDEDFKCAQGSISLKYKGSNLLKQVSKVYTRKMFSIFEKSFMEGAIGVSIVNEVMYDDNSILYGTAQCDEDQDGKNWFVNLNTSTGEAKCSCRGFETKGIQCKHVLRIFIHRTVKQVPAQYLLKRFCLNAKRGIYLPYLPSMAQKESNMIFRNHLMRFTYDLSLQIESCQPAKELVMTAMNDLARRVEALVVEDANHNHKEESSLRDPPKKRPKGISNTRLKGYWEKNTKKSSNVLFYFNVYKIFYVFILCQKKLI